MFDPIPGFIFMVLPATLFIYAVFAGNTRVLAFACLLGFGGTLCVLKDTQERLNVAEHKVFMLELAVKYKVDPDMLKK